MENNSYSIMKRPVFLIFCWALYDLANQFFALNVISVYFPRWLTVEKGAPEIFYSIAFGVSMVLVALIAPFLGTVSDVQRKKKVYLISFTVLAVIFTAFLGISRNVFLNLFFFAIANAGCQIAIVFYNALILRVADKKQMGLVSGIGRCFAYGGAILALFLSKPIIARYGYQATFLLTAACFLFFSLPAMIFIKEEAGTSPRLTSFLTKDKLREIFKKITFIFTKNEQFKDLRQFLIIFFFSLCALQTMMLFMSVYIGEVFHLNEQQIIDLIIFSTFFGIGGSILAGVICDFWGHKRAMIGVFGLWLIAFVAGGFLRAPFQWLVGAVVGVALSSTWVVARAWVVRLVPEENIGEVFGLFNLVGYTAGIVGPLFWGLVRLKLAPLGEWGYRYSLLSLFVFIILAFYHLMKVPKDENLV